VFANNIGISERIIEFEKAYAAELCSFQSGDYLIWPIIKPRIFIHYFYPPGKHTENRSKSIAIAQIWQKTEDLFVSIALYVRWVLLIGRKPTLVYSDGAARYHRNSLGKMCNLFLDALVTKSLVPDGLLVEYRQSKIRDGNLRLFHNARSLSIYKLFCRIYIRRLQRGKYLKACQDIGKLMACATSNINIPSQLIEDIVTEFHCERLAYRHLLTVLHPRMAVTYDKVCQGFTAACKEKGVPLIDLQHGIIGKHFPEYNFIKVFKTVKHKFALPSVIAVFGNLERNQILANGFWTEQEVVAVGANRMCDIIESKYKLNSDGNSVLFVSQNLDPNIYLPSILALARANYQIMIVHHPLERQEYLTQYADLLNDHAANVSIADKAADLYDLLASSAVVVGYNSTVLLESRNLGIFTVSVEAYPGEGGIFRFYDDSKLHDYLKLASHETIVDVVNTYLASKQLLLEPNDYFYSRDFEKEIKMLVTKMQHNEN
jgi:hypothetical protein